MAVALAVLLWLTVAGEHLVERSLRVPLEFETFLRRSRSSAIRPTASTCGCAGRRLCSAGSSRARSWPCWTSGRRARGRGCSTSATTKCARLTESRWRRSFPAQSLSRWRSRPGARFRSCRRSTASPRRGSCSGRVRPSPATVEVAGPESRLRRLTGATTEPVDVTDARARVADVVTVGIADSAVRLVKAQNATGDGGDPPCAWWSASSPGCR